MTGSSIWSVASALSVVLGLLALLSFAVARIRRTREHPSLAGRIDVVSRIALAPKQGVATIRIGERTLLVSYGEGGVRRLMDLDDTVPESGARQDTDLSHERPTSKERPGLTSVMSLLRTLSIVLLIGSSLPLGVAAQDAAISVESTDSAASASTVGAVIRQFALPQMQIDLDGSGEEGLSLPGPVGVVVFMGLMTLIPTLLLLTTGFTRILIVLHLLKQALGTQTAPPAHLLAAMALLHTGFVMAPTFEEVNRTALTPWMDGSINEGEMVAAATIPVRSFMLAHTREQDLGAFIDMHHGPRPETIEEIPLIVVMSSFVTSELTTAFQMGFALFLPFMVIDIVVASVLMSMGMFMLPPVMISLPFKLLLFVLVDGWSLVMGSLLQSF